MTTSAKPAVTCSHAKLTQEGFSLIEVAVVLTVLGLLLIPALHMYTLEVQSTNLAEKRVSVATATIALNKYVLMHRRYPTPALPGAGLGNAAFGRPAVMPVTGWPDCQAGVPPVGMVCRTTLNTFDGRAVLIGVLPFSDIGVPYTSVVDANRNLLTYAITEDLTSAGTYTENGGGIIVRILTSPDDDTPIDMYSGTEARSHFVVVSHGEDARGGTGQGGEIVAACGTDADSDDFENCNNDGTFRSNVIGGSSERSVKSFYAAGTSHFDDYLIEKNSSAGGMWSYIRDGSGDLNIEDRSGGNVAIGACDNRDPCIPLSRLDVYGTADGATAGRVPAVRSPIIKTKRLCGRGTPAGDPMDGGSFPCVSDYNLVSNVAGDQETSCIGADCPAESASWSSTNMPPWLTPELIVGSPPLLPESGDYWMTTADHGSFHRGNGVRCVSARGLNGIFDRDEACNDTSTVTPATKTRIGACLNVGEYARGVDATGKLICQLPSDNR
jgi:prepilin-type N-terminal cleavage/methylation domain-containing protein